MKEGNVYSIFKSKIIRLEQYKLFIQNSFKFTNTALILQVFSQGFVATYKHISFIDLKEKKDHFRVLNTLKPLSCSGNRKSNITRNYLREMSHFISLIRSMTNKNFGNKSCLFLITAIRILHVLHITVCVVAKE